MSVHFSVECCRSALPSEELFHHSRRFLLRHSAEVRSFKQQLQLALVVRRVVPAQLASLPYSNADKQAFTNNLMLCGCQFGKADAKDRAP